MGDAPGHGTGGCSRVGRDRGTPEINKTAPIRVAADTITVDTIPTLDTGAKEHVEEQDEADPASANPDPYSWTRVRHGRKTRMAEFNEFALLFMNMFKEEIRREIEPLEQ